MILQVGHFALGIYRSEKFVHLFRSVIGQDLDFMARRVGYVRNLVKRRVLR